MGVIIVTGCSGRIGTRVCKRFIDNGFKVVGFDIREPSPEAGAIDFVHVDITSDENVRRGFDHVRHKYGDRIHSIIHLAAYFSFSENHADLYNKITIQGTGRLLENAKTFKTEQFLFSSTMLVYKPTRPGQRISESSTIDPRWNYPKANVKTENLMHKLRGPIPIVVMRIAGCYDEECHSFPISNVIKRIYERQFTSWVFPGDITHGTSYIHLNDLADAIWLAVQKRAELPEETTLIVGEGKTMSYDGMQRLISKLIEGKELHTIRVPKWFAKTSIWALNQFPSQENTIEPWMIDLADDHYELDISRARLLLGWTPKHFVASVIPQMIQFLKENPEEFYEANDLAFPQWLKDKMVAYV